MNAKSLKRAFGLAAAAVSTTGMMMLAPTAANAATARPVHAQTVSTASYAPKAGHVSWGFRDGRPPPGGYYHRHYYRHPYYYHHRYYYRHPYYRHRYYYRHPYYRHRYYRRY
ncbi:MAG TPA: hypothetical protein VE733_22000 [Streptosporangiaceae bacterium]|nr:hypothetical protein [Streptosporangiaceae bacterium]